jgi:Flp pilus assembly protein TadD
MKATRKPPGSPCSNMMPPQRNSCAPKQDRHSLSAVLSWKHVLLFALAMAVSVIPCCAQKNIAAALNAYGRAGKYPDRVHSSALDTNPAANEEMCFPWNLSEVRATTVSVTRLKVPSQARREYEKACDASYKNNFEEAEQHARSAIEKFQDYSAAWVMLGLILEEQHKAQVAHDACSHAATIDATYLPAYLCAAEVSVRNQEWQGALSSADLALSLKSQGDAYPNYYRATAYLHMNNLVEAKKSALQAAEIDVNHSEPSLYFLLAKIYEREGDDASAIAQLRQLLKRHTDRLQENMAKQYLAKLESQQSTK